MTWLINLFTQPSVGQHVVAIALTAAVGLMVGKIKVKGISLGGAGALFVGILLGHLGLRVEGNVLHFIQEFGLILFVFAIGLQVGPGFFRSFRKDGITMNLMAIALVALAVITTFVIHLVTGEDLAIMTGVMSGAVTNTPGLGAAQQILEEGIFVVILGKNLFRVNLDKEREAASKGDNVDANAYRVACRVENPALFGKSVHDIVGEVNSDHLVIARMKRAGEVFFPDLDLPLQEGDELLIVTDVQHKDKAGIIFGLELPVEMKDWQKPGTELVSRRLSITKSVITGHSLRNLDIRQKYGVTVTRILRSGIELQADADLILQVGDSIQVVGSEEGIRHLSKFVGNQPESLRKPNLVPIFFGIALGVLLGMAPIHLSTMPQPLKLGLAGGPLIVAILLGHFGPKLRITTYTALSANLMIREMGISLFMAAVGLGAGENFVSSLMGGGYVWVLYGALITLIPMLVVAFVSRLVLKMDFFKVCGLLSGGTTDPALLSFSEQMYGSSRIAVNYATVYPLTMFLRVVAAQVLIMSII